MRLYFLLFFLWVSVSSIHAQWTISKEIKGEYVELETDHKGDIYAVTKNGEVSKFNKQGELLVEYSPVFNQPINQLDINSQFKVFLFYKDFQQAVILNRYLSDPVSINFSDFFQHFVTDLSPDLNQNLWIISLGDLSLKLIDPNRKTIIETKSLSRLLNQSEVKNLVLKSHNNRTYLIENNQSIYTFDNLGNHLFSFEINSESEPGIWKDELYYTKGKKLLFVNLYDRSSRQIELPNQEPQKIRYTGSQLILLHSKGLTIYD